MNGFKITYNFSGTLIILPPIKLVKHSDKIMYLIDLDYKVVYIDNINTDITFSLYVTKTLHPSLKVLFIDGKIVTYTYKRGYIKLHSYAFTMKKYLLSLKIIPILL